MTALYEVEGVVAVIRLDHPPVNGLCWSTRRLMVEAFDRAAADPAIEVIVLTGGDAVFSAGADIHEFASSDLLRAPTLRDLLDAVESIPKPVVAAINKLALGGGLELALASNYRVVSAEAQVGLPEVRLGLLPGGGAQRLPRAVGLERALAMIVSGDSVQAKDLEGTRLFDLVVDGDALPSALALARDLHTTPQARPRLEDLKVNHPNPEGFLERAATKFEHADSLAKARSLSSIAVVGGGTMGTSIAMALQSPN